MKKLLLSALSICAGVLFVQAQGYTLKDLGGNTINTQTIDITIDVSTSLSTYEFDCTNTGSLSKNSYMERQEQTVVPGTQNYFCWDVCYPPFVGTSTSGVTIAATGTYTLGSVDYQPQGQLGMTTIRYVIYDYANPNDSVWFTVRWNVTPMGIQENLIGTLVSAFPNPSSTSTQVKYEFSGASEGTLCIYNLLGEEIKSIALNSTKGTALIDVAEMKNGIYFYSLVAGEKTLATRKFTVAH